MSIQALFPTFVYYEDLEKKRSRKFGEELVRECYQIRDADRAGRKWSAKHYLGGYTSYSSMSHLHKMSSTFMELEKRIMRHVRRYVDHLEFDMKGSRVEMTDCWVNIMPHQVVHSLHLHPLSLISGTYYVQTPRNCSSIKFEDPRMSKFMAAPPRRSPCAKHNKQYMEYKAQAGKVVLFESWLRHEVAANPATTDRISISFNYGWV